MALTIPKSLSGTPASIRSQAEALLARATTLKEIDSIVALARSSNVNIDSTKLSTAKNTISQATAKAKASADKAAADKAIADKAAAQKATLDKTLAAQKVKQDAANKVIADKAAAEKAKADLIAKQQASNAISNAAAAKKQAEAIAADKAAAEKTAAEKTAAEKTAAEKTAATAATSAGSAANPQNARNTFVNKLNSRTITQADIDQYQKDIVAAGGKIDDGLVRMGNDQAIQNKNLAERTAKDQAAAASAKTRAAQVEDYWKQLDTVKSTQELKDIQAKITADGITDSSLLYKLNKQNTIIGGQERAAKEQLTRDFQSQIGSAKSADELASIVKQAGDQGVAIDTAQVDLRNKTIADTAAKQAAATAKMATDVKAFEAKLPGTLDANYLRQLDPEFMGVGPYAGQTGMTNYLSMAYRDKTVNIDGKNYKLDYRQMTGPDNSVYVYVPTDVNTGTTGGWLKSVDKLPTSGYGSQTWQSFQYVPVDNPTAKPVDYKGSIAPYKQDVVQNNYQSANSIYQSFEARVAADQAAANAAAKARYLKSQEYDFFRGTEEIGQALASFDKLVNSTVGWKTIATIAGSVVGGPWGATLANATAGAIAGEDIGTIAKGAALTFATAYGTQALSQAMSATADAAATAGVSGGAEMSAITALADSTDDSIAALNAMSGWTGSDMSYLQSVGMPEVIMKAAVESNALLGLPTTVEAWNTYNAERGVTTPTQGPVTNQAGEALQPGEVPANPNQPVQPDDFVPEQAGPVQPDDFVPEQAGPIQPEAPGFTEPEIIYSDIPGAEVELPRNPDLVRTSTGPQGRVTVDVSSSPVEPPGGWGSQPIPNIPADMTLPGDLGGTYYPNGIPLEEVVVTASRELGLTPAQIIALGGVAAATAAVATMGSAGAASAANAAVVPPSTTPAPVEPPVVETPPGPAEPGPIEPAPVEPPVVETPPGPIEPAPVEPPVVETPPGPIEPIPVEPPVVETPPGPIEPIPPVEPPVVETPPGPAEPIPPVEPPVVETPPGPIEPIPPVEPPVVETPPGPIETPPGPIETPPGPAEPGPIEPGPIETPPVDAPPVEPTKPPVEVIDKSTPIPETGPGSPGYQPPTQDVIDQLAKAYNVDAATIAKWIAAGVVLPMLVPQIPQPPTIKRPNYGPLDPINWGAAGGLVNPGVNPGFVIGPARQPFYQTTSPVQSKYFYGTRPLIQTQDQIQPTLQDRTLAPATPFGLQQMQQGYNINQVLNQINQTPLNPNFVGYNQYPTAGYQPIGPVIPPT